MRFDHLQWMQLERLRCVFQYLEYQMLQCWYLHHSFVHRYQSLILYPQLEFEIPSSVVTNAIAGGGSQSV